MKYQIEYAVQEKQKIIEKLQDENASLQQRIYSLERYIHDLQSQFTSKQTEIMSTAYLNADVIIAKAISIAYSFKIELEQLWLDIENKQNDPIKLLRLIDDFLEKTKQIFLVNIRNNNNLMQDIENILQAQKVNNL